MTQINTALIEKILAPQVKFEGRSELPKFARFFCDLYRIELFKPGLDLILTKLQEKDLSFEVHIIKNWDTNLGCYLTQQSTVFNKVAGVFSRKIKKTIIIKSFLHNVLAHEMAHALEFESGLALETAGFRKCIGFDMKDRQADLITLSSEIKRLMVDALKAYPQEQFLSELFARYFELLSVSRDVQGRGDFESRQVMDFFANTTKFITDIFNPAIQAKIDRKIAGSTVEIAAAVKVVKAETKFQDKVNSFYKKPDVGGQKSWSKNVKSNAGYQASWQQYQALEDDKKDK